MKKLITLVTFTCSFLYSQFIFAEVAIIVHPDNTAEFDKKTVSKIFLGKSKKFSTGETALPVTTNGAASNEFNEKLLNKSSSQIKAYWSKLLFTGKGTPPKVLDNDEEVKKMVAGNPNIIGYIDATKADDSVKTILTL